MRGISKGFPGVQALKDVSLTAWPGEIHALMGENGAGKSTLMKILAGAYAADEGRIAIEGTSVAITGPQAAREAGIALIYQELSLAPNLTVAENIFLGDERRNVFGLVRRAGMRAEAQEVLDSLGAPFSAGTVVGSLSIAEQQQVEIARALHRRSRVLVMDEPTTALSARETGRLFDLIRRLRETGIAIIYISHRMAEVYELADRVSVLRDGQYIGSLDRDELSAPKLVQMMVGRTLKDFFRKEGHTEIGHTVLEVEGLTDGDKMKPATFHVKAGEVLGLSGLVGAGRTELARLIFGADRPTAGTVRLEGETLSVREPSDAIKAGIGYLPENRKEQGLFLDMVVRENIAISVLGRDAHPGGIYNRGKAESLTQSAIDDLSIRVNHGDVRSGGLSGGNQQKLLVARWLAIHPKVLILDEPTRGVDVGAKAEIYRIVNELTAKGVAVIFISSELPEIIGMSDRVLVLREGAIVGELGGETGAEITQEAVMAHATGTSELTQGELTQDQGR